MNVVQTPGFNLVFFCILLQFFLCTLQLQGGKGKEEEQKSRGQRTSCCRYQSSFLASSFALWSWTWNVIVPQDHMTQGLLLYFTNPLGKHSMLRYRITEILTEHFRINNNAAVVFPVWPCSGISLTGGSFSPGCSSEWDYGCFWNHICNW